MIHGLFVIDILYDIPAFPWLYQYTWIIIISFSFWQGLPEKFVSAMRTLFDVMDDKKTGFISLADIESRWCADNEGGSVPTGVIDSLRSASAELPRIIATP